MKPRGEEGLTPCHMTMQSGDEVVNSRALGGSTDFGFQLPASLVALAPSQLVRAIVSLSQTIGALWIY